MKVLVATGDPRLTRFLVRGLRETGITVDRAEDGAEVLQRVETGVHGVCVLDAAVHGLDACHEIRRRAREVQVLMLVANDAEQQSAVSAGANDCILKPIDWTVFSKHLRVVMERARTFKRTRAGDLAVDRLDRQITLRGRALKLTAREFGILSHLAFRSNRIVSRAELVSHVWETNLDPGFNTIDVHVSRIRTKLGDAAWMLETIPRVGYRLRSRKAA